MSISSLKWHGGLWCGLLLYCGVCFGATSLEEEPFSVHGFGTFGVSHSNHEQLGWRPSLLQRGRLDDQWEVINNSYLGVQVNTPLTEQWEAVLQLVAREHDYQGAEDLVDWAYLSYRPNADYELRAGRIGVPIYLLSEYRSVRFAQFWTHPPTEFYGLLSGHAFDGIEVTRFFQGVGGLWQWSNSIGHADLPSYVVTESTLYDDKVYNIDFHSAVSSVLSYENETWLVQLSISGAKLADEYQFMGGLQNAYAQLSQFGFGEAAALSEALQMENERVYYAALGAAYDNAVWVVQGEVNRIESDTEMVNSSVNGYASLGRRVGDWTFYSIVSHAHSLDDRKLAPLLPIQDGELLQELTQRVFNALRAEQTTFALGARWDLTPQVAVKGQWDRTWLEGDALLLYSVQPWAKIRGNPQIDTFSVQLDFLF